jgi:hypothetical protein
MSRTLTRKTTLAALIASVLGSLTLTGTAEANGVRLGFGGPMPSFVATPTHGGGGSYNTASGYGRSAHCAKKKPSYSVASRSRAVPHSEPKVARSEPRHVVRREKVEVASVQHTVSKPKVSSSVVEKVEKVVSDVTTPENSNGLTGSKALVQNDNAATTAAANAPTDTSATETPAANQTTVATAPAAVETANETAAVEPQPEVKAEEPAKDVGCKKFIPSVGVTIDVGCDK